MTLDPAPHAGSSRRALPLLDVEAELRAFEARERERLGLGPSRQWKEPLRARPFTRAERGRVTVLLGGLTGAQDRFVEAALIGLGHRAKALSAPDVEALVVGKEVGNRGQCNPTYFTVGNLVKYLQHLRDVEGKTTQEIVDGWVFLTAGACGPCRFGMYQTEYRKALREAGFDGFRIVLFQQQGGLDQAAGEELGLDLGTSFYLALATSLAAGDVLNALGYRLRPYEVVPGATDRALAEAQRLCWEALAARRSVLVALARARRLFAAVEVDRTRVKPKVAIIGEFWAMTTEGDGNYRLQRFLEEQGAEVEIQLVTAWVLYNIWEVAFDTRSRVELRGADRSPRGLAGEGEGFAFERAVKLFLAEAALRLGFQLFARLGGLYGQSMPDMDELARLAAPYYDNDLRGGEGHMEVGKVLANAQHRKATLVVSVKPFGCMPSSAVSDGVQSLVTERFPGTLFCAVETSGDGAVNFQSRVLMSLARAKRLADEEAAEALSASGLDLESARASLAREPALRDPLRVPRHYVSSTAANLFHELGERARSSRLERAGHVVRGAGSRGAQAARAAVRGLPSALRLAGRAAVELGDLAWGAARARLAAGPTRA
ncbi:MAG: 2-hydroxyglutaryl-CoA dehydratase [Polyangiaceae bacterium]|nr:2-hydroxyglutaryl-CoA dehydratase [Polyangiaceae bacterium]